MSPYRSAPRRKPEATEGSVGNIAVVLAALMLVMVLVTIIDRVSERNRRVRPVATPGEVSPPRGATMAARR
jgi:hypothetical protein